MSKLSKKQRRMLLRILIAAVLLIVLRLLPGGAVPEWLLYLIPYAVIGWDVLYKCIRNIAHGQVFDENFLMGLATVGAFGTGEYSEAVFVMLFYQVGELFQDYAVGRSRASITELMDIRPDTANLEREDGSLEEADPEDVEVGAVIVVNPGERVPLDGIVLEGASSLDTAALTGEAEPRSVERGDEVISGCVNLSGVLRVQVTKPSEESTVSRILELVENAGERKAESEQFITRFARYYTPCVVCAALALFLIPTLLLKLTPAVPTLLQGTAPGDWLHRALVFLVISCPCALVISVPLSFFGGIGGASRQGILIKGGSYLETLAGVDTVVFDKTGTLTEGSFTVSAVCPERGFSAEELTEYAALAELHSTHPIALSLRAACAAEPDAQRLGEVQELAGYGVLARIDGREILVGSRRLLEKQGVEAPEQDAAGSVVYVAADGRYAGSLVISDRPKPDAAEAVAALRRCGVRRSVMLTGDAEGAARQVAEELGLDEFHAKLLPADKVERVEALRAQGGKVAFVGDGINDAPVLTAADVGIAMGALGSDAAIEAADVVLMDDRPAKLALAIRIARKTVRIVRQNIIFALAVKALVLLLGALGYAPLWAAVFADVGVAFLAILNSMRCLRTDTL